MNCGPPLSICPPCRPLPTMWRPAGEGGGQTGAAAPARSTESPITFQCCFSALCKEQSVLISMDSRRMLIQCHTDSLQRETEAALACRLTAGCLQQISERRLVDFFFYYSNLSTPYNLWTENLLIFKNYYFILHLWFIKAEVRPYCRTVGVVYCTSKTTFILHFDFSCIRWIHVSFHLV